MKKFKILEEKPKAKKETFNEQDFYLTWHRDDENKTEKSITKRTKTIKKINYKELFSVAWKVEKTLLRLCPNIKHASGIYVWTRTNEIEKCAYVGKAKDLIDRSISHLMGYKQRIDQSLRKWGLYDEQYNKTGWKLGILFYPENKLDCYERALIKKYQDVGYDLYNIESGGTADKTDINERKLGKGYYDGVAYGKKKIKDELNYIINKYLVIGLKKDNKLSQKALAKFYRILSEEK